MTDICKQQELISVLPLQLYSSICSADIFMLIFKCNYWFNCRLEFKNVVLMEILRGEMEKLTGGWREL